MCEVKALSPQRVNNQVPLRPIALPVEHGGWSLLLEPVALGLLLAPSPTGILTSVAAIGLFLARHPYKLALRDWQRGRRGRRAVLAQTFALFYLLVALLAGSLAVKTGGTAFLLPLTLAVPFAIVQLALDSVGRGRSLIAELAGAAATGSLATAVALSGGWPRATAFALWVIMAARSIPTIFYLRARLRLRRQKPASRSLPLISHMGALAVIVGLSLLALAPWLAGVAMLFLLIRALLGLYSSGNETTPQRLGVGELSYGLMTVVLTCMGYVFSL
jgi:YwiC-like protein